MSVEWDVNYIAVVVATIVGLVIGTVYYMPQRRALPDRARR